MVELWRIVFTILIVRSMVVSLVRKSKLEFVIMYSNLSPYSDHSNELGADQLNLTGH